MADISETQRVEYSQRLLEHYTPDGLPYHNRQHALDVARRVSELSKLSKDEQTQRHRRLLFVAAIGHDADYHLPLDPTLHQTREERSAKLLIEMFPELTDDQAQLAYDAIIDTTVAREEKSSLFGATLHIADVGYIAEPYQQFLKNLRHYHAEIGRPPQPEMITATRDFAKHAIAEAGVVFDEILSPQHRDAWLDQAKNNVTRLEVEGATTRVL